jgi:hypothetical protein
MLDIPGIELELDQVYKDYKKDFLTPEFADKLFEVCKLLPHERPKTELSDFKYFLLRWRMPLFARDPGLVPAPTMNQWVMPLANAPDEIKELADMLSKEAGKSIDYLSLNGYENERDIIDWHQHREDDCRDARVLIVSLGEERTFGLRPVCEKGRLCGKGNESVCEGYKGCVCGVCRAAKRHRKTKCEICSDKSKWIEFPPKHGSLINLPNEFNSTYEHAVLDDSGTKKHPIKKGLRISINTNAGENLQPREYRYAGELGAPKTESTEVVHCKRDKFDIYIGKVNGKKDMKGYLPESPFANRSGGDYEAYLKAKLLSDPAHASRLMDCHGKRLGCWCKGTSRDFSKCHGHIVAKWADRIFEKWQELKPDKAVMRAWIDETAKGDK